MKNATRVSSQPKWRRRVSLCILIAALTAGAFYLAGESPGFTLFVILFLIAGYLLIDATMVIRSPALSNTPFIERAAETQLGTGKFLMLALAIGTIFAAALLGIGYLLSP